MSEVKHVRANRVMAAAVERGLFTSWLRGVFEGAVAMQRDEVPLPVAQRVLLHPKRRRSADWLPRGETPARTD